MISTDNPFYPIAALTGFQDAALLRTGFIAALLGSLPDEVRVRYYTGRLAGEAIDWRLQEVFDPEMGLHCPRYQASFECLDASSGDHQRLHQLEWQTATDPMCIAVQSPSELALMVRRGSTLSAVLVDAEAVEQYLQSMEAILMVYLNLNRLLERGSVDSLTGLFNRRTFEEKLRPLFSEEGSHRRHGEAGRDDYLAMIDIDFFKLINDRFGHLYGDEVLVLLGRLMQETFRDQDWLFRIGGEEFVVVARGVSGDPAPIFERFRLLVAEQVFAQVGQVTISLGYTRIERQQSLSDVLGRADESLYYAKENGRNQIAHYETLRAQGLLLEKTNDGDVHLF